MSDETSTSATVCWVIADVHGHAGMLDALLQKIERRTPGAALWFVGDLVNRGPDDLATLRLVRDLGDRARVVLGNHDCVVLACAAGFTAPRRGDTIGPLMASAEIDDHVDWLRSRPLLLERGRDVVVHAGLHPDWDLGDARRAAARIEAALQADDWATTLERVWGCRGAPWDARVQGHRRLGDDLAAFTRMRFVRADGALDTEGKRGPESPPPGTMPWYAAPHPPRDVRVVFGHWAAHGVSIGPRLAALDAGCAWGGPLTALCLDDGAVLQQPHRR